MPSGIGKTRESISRDANRLAKVDRARAVRYHATLMVLASSPDSANIMVADST